MILTWIQNLLLVVGLLALHKEGNLSVKGGDFGDHKTYGSMTLGEHSLMISSWTCNSCKGGDCELGGRCCFFRYQGITHCMDSLDF